MKIIYFANTDWYLYNFRKNLADAMRASGHEVVILSPPGKYGELLEQEGFRWIQFPMSRRGINPLAELLTIRRLERIYATEKPDLVHHFTVKCVLYGSLAARRTGVKCVVNAITGLGYLFVGRDVLARLLHRLVLGLYRFALRGTKVIFQNPDDERLFQEAGLISREQSSLIRGSGIDVHQFSPLPESEASTPLVVLPARMLWNKGVAEFVEAAHILRREGLAARFALVGVADAGNPDAIPYEKLSEWQKEGIVDWWGWQEDIRVTFAMAHIVCLPSYREGVPRVLIEAAACRRPLVTTDTPGCREIVKDGVNGLLVPPRDALALADALRQLISNPQLRQEMGARGRRIVEEEYSAEKVVAETLAVYRQMVGESG